MFIIIVLVLLLVLKLADVWIFAAMSWWWIIGLASVAFLWFEFFERMLGLDKRKDHAHFEKIKQERVKRAFEKKTGRRS
ncbi:MAG: TIGR04438 family Trp-rich protein [Burkholderiales bacterium]|nr:TIGR04438 family Trp-rich protein [Burkholderiales bacterium]